MLYGILFVGAKGINPLNPLLWLYFSWNILFINAFSGILIYHPRFDLFFPIIFCICVLLTFLLGYYISNIIYSQRKVLQELRKELIIVSRQEVTFILKLISISSLLLTFSLGYLVDSSSSTFHQNAKNKEFADKLQKLNTYRANKIAKIFSICSIVAALLFAFEIICVYNGNILAPALLRETFSERDATLLSQLSGILFFGGLFSVTAFLLLGNSSNRTWYILGIFSFAFGSVLSAGRQMVFQLIISSTICYLILKYNSIKLVIPKKYKFFFGITISLIVGYFAFISTLRSTVVEGDDRTKSDMYSSLNNFSYSDDFQEVSMFLPDFINNTITDYTFYFSHEIIAFADWWHINNISILDVKFARFSPFFERQIDRLHLGFETQQSRLSNESKKEQKGSIFNAGWLTTNAQLLQNLGFIGAFLFVFFHGFLSQKLYYHTLLFPTFGSVNLCVANNIILLNTISNSAFSETQVFFYIIISIWLLNKKI